MIKWVRVEVVAMGGETGLLESNAQLAFGFAPPASTVEAELAPPPHNPDLFQTHICQGFSRVSSTW